MGAAGSSLKDCGFPVLPTCRAVRIVVRVNPSTVQGVPLLYRRMSHRAATAAIAMAALVAATAQAYAPPRGTPNLAEMTLQPSDLAPGATLLVNGYSDPGGSGLHVRAEFDRDWGAASTTAGVKLQQVQTTITLAASTKWAQAVLGQVPGIYGASAGHEDLMANIDAGNGSSATIKDARFSKLRSIGVGQQSVYGSATIATKGSTLIADFAWVRVDAGIAFVLVVAPKPLADSVTIALARTLAAHMTSVLGPH